MYIFDDHYHKLNQNLLRIFGLWPYKKTKFERFRATCFYMILISNVIAQFTQLAIADRSVNVIIRILSDALPAMAYVVKFNIFFFDTKKLKQMLEEIINNRRMLTDPQEIKIVEHYARQGKTVTIMMLMIFMVFTFLIMELIPDILDFFRPLNESRAHYMSFLNEYHMNKGIQFYYFLLYSVISLNIGVFSVISISSMLLLIALHCCALFKICSYRIQHSVDKKVIACSNKRNLIVERLIRTVELHQNAQKLFKLLMTNLAITYLIVLLIGTCSFVVNLYRLFHAITSMDNLMDFIIAMSYITGHEIYLFGATFMGQQFVNHADELFNAIYMSLWYKTPVSVQKFFLFIMQISSKNVVANVAGLHVIVMETFTSVMSTGISFVMVIYSLQ
ncbi:uncharacterized protein LOC143895458 isoform X2 [Temnothorax americanus]|uniref:uncharacterized protein LOC143895458 isoform X2 n=1 Tax=Temnothorax americanus TaxID=1964332 RepID=UPI00406905BE